MEKPEQKTHFYANAVNITSSVYDVSFNFKSQTPQIDDSGQMMQISGQPVINVDDEIIIRMSPQHAKALSALLAKQIIEYEKQFKIKLPLPPELEKLWESALASGEK